MDMEAALVGITSMIVDIAVEEMIVTIMGSKCCLYSKSKWKKIRAYMKKDKHERALRVAEQIVSHQILDFANKIEEPKKIIITSV